MQSLELKTQSFVVKIWIEEIPEDSGRPTWRGHITHVPGGERRYLQTLDEIAAFVTPYLEAMSVRSPREGDTSSD